MSIVNFIIQGILLGTATLILILIFLYWIRWIKDRCFEQQSQQQGEVQRAHCHQEREQSEECENVEVEHFDLELGNKDSIRLLSQKAVDKHIHPECETEDDAIKISEKRNKMSKTLRNHVFQVKETEFDFVYENGRNVIKCKRFCTYWDCRRSGNGDFRVSETGQMCPIFSQSPDCHLLVGRSLMTRIQKE